MKKINDIPITGLTQAQVEQRIKDGRDNRDCSVKTKTVKRIIFENLFTLFNILNFAFALALMLVGSFKNTLFMGVVAANTLIGIIQEIRSKRAVDRLSIVVSKRAAAIRDSKRCEIPIEAIVEDDIIILKRGEQIPADCRVIRGACSVNESLLTGESEVIRKAPGDRLLSGSFLTSGECYARVEKTGKEYYAAKINNEARYIKKAGSQIMSTLKKIVAFVSAVIIPMAAVLMYRQLSLSQGNIKTAVVNVTAALIGMIPDGLVLLTSTVLAVSVLRLAQKGVLVQELYCVETLARVDTLCLDKTGTITEDKMQVEELIPLNGADRRDLMSSLASAANSMTDINSTMQAICDFTRGAPDKNVESRVEFSSEAKWSAVNFENGGSLILGAGEIIDPAGTKSAFEQLGDRVHDYRSVCVFTADGKASDGRLPQNPVLSGVILIKDKIRENACKTVEYFIRQGVSLKVISGDSPAAAARVARQAGVPNCERFIDMSKVGADESLEEIAESYTVFGRVTPERKKQLIKALKSSGRTVAMTGDGVNDVLALKEADCSVAMASGSEAARNAAQLVLTENDFSAMPSVVAEGRRTINNIERSASLFLSKTLYAIMLAVSFLFISMRYPFQPIQMTLISAFGIGLPSFVLALEPNTERVKGSFLKNVLSNAAPCSLTTVIGIFAAMLCGRAFSLEYSQISTLAVIVTAFSCVMLICRISYPFTKIRAALLVVSATGLALGILVFGDFFSLCKLTSEILLLAALLMLLAFICFNLLYFLFDKFKTKTNGNKKIGE